MDIEKELAALAKTAGGAGVACLTISVGESACGASVALSISLPHGHTMQFTGHNVRSILDRARQSIEAEAYSAQVIDFNGRAFAQQ